MRRAKISAEIKIYKYFIFYILWIYKISMYIPEKLNLNLNAVCCFPEKFKINNPSIVSNERINYH